MACTWRQALAGSLKKNKEPYDKWYQLATVRADGRPANRTVVHRGFMGESDRLLSISDTRAHKIEELNRDPHVEACWYFTGSREQYRLSGTALVVDKDTEDSELQKARFDTWKGMSPKAKQQYLWPQPGLPRGSDNSPYEQDPPEDDVPPMDTFCVLVLEPTEVDHLQLRENERREHRSTVAEDGTRQWSVQNVNV